MVHLVPRGNGNPAVRAVLVVGLLGAISACGGAPGQPDATFATASPPAPAASIAAPPSATSIVLGSADIGRQLSAGAYQVGDPFAAPFTITLPDGMELGSLVEGDVSFKHESDWVIVEVFENLFADPCHADGPVDPPIRPTVDAIVTGLSQMVGFKVGKVSDVVLGRHSGKSFELTNTVDTSTAGCSRGLMLPLWTYRGGIEASTNGGLREQLWVIDVDGIAVIVARGGPGIDPVAASIEFE